eukprot:11189338-Lingulodinium_polyedra.AAC.1
MPSCCATGVSMRNVGWSVCAPSWHRATLVGACSGLLPCAHNRAAFARAATFGLGGSSLRTRLGLGHAAPGAPCTL